MVLNDRNSTFEKNNVMRKIGIFLLLVQNLFAQNPNPKELNVFVKNIHYDFNLSDGREKFGKDENNLEPLYDIFVYLNIDGFDLENPIDFDNFSLIENEYKIRRRPVSAGFRSFWLVATDLKDFHGEDNFLKYSQEGITDFDHFNRIKNPWKPTIYRQERFYPLRIPLKKNKSKEFIIHFYVKNREKGQFSLYYKDKLVKAFYLERGDNLKYKQ
jgi:hypothetical protein